jgi:hypothetical protein
MTTTVTITTHSWPVEVTTTDDYENGDVRTHSATTHTLPANSAGTFYLTNTRSMAFRELPIPHEDASAPAEAATPAA